MSEKFYKSYQEASEAAQKLDAQSIKDYKECLGNKDSTDITSNRFNHIAISMTEYYAHQEGEEESLSKMVSELCSQEKN